MHRNFDTSRQAQSDEPVTFTICGQDFKAVAGRKVPASALMDVLVSDQLTQGKALADFFDLVLEEESAARFVAQMHDRENPISIPDFIEIFQYLVEAYSGHPFAQAASSGNGHAPTGPTSTPGVSLEASTPGT